MKQPKKDLHTFLAPFKVILKYFWHLFITLYANIDIIMTYSKKCLKYAILWIKMSYFAQKCYNMYKNEILEVKKQV